MTWSVLIFALIVSAILILLAFSDFYRIRGENGNYSLMRMFRCMCFVAMAQVIVFTSAMVVNAQLTTILIEQAKQDFR